MAVSVQPGYPLQVRDPLLHGLHPDIIKALFDHGIPFTVLTPTPQMDETQNDFCAMENKLSYSLWKKISCFPPVWPNGIVLRCFGKKVIYVCNPLTYASVPHCNYIQKYCGQKDVLFVGMNPGRNGMAQNGIPFGDPEHVRTFLHIGLNVELPPGLQCDKREKSGHRFWGLMRKEYDTVENFFRNCFVHNYCPLLFLDKDGKHISLNDIPANERRIIEEDCDKALRKCIEIIKPKIIVAVGDNAEKRIEHVKKQSDIFWQWEKICDPASRDMTAEVWEELASFQLQKCNIPLSGFVPPSGQPQNF